MAPHDWQLLNEVGASRVFGVRCFKLDNAFKFVGKSIYAVTAYSISILPVVCSLDLFVVSIWLARWSQMQGVRGYKTNYCSLVPWTFLSRILKSFWSFSVKS